jgi:hypothetical protein
VNKKWIRYQVSNENHEHSKSQIIEENTTSSLDFKKCDAKNITMNKKYTNIK